MRDDPRFKNELPEGTTVASYLTNYSRVVSDALAKVPAAKIQAAFDAVSGALARGARVYVAGNGGSAAIGDHLCCDWMKGTSIPGKPSLKVHSLTASTALVTALANDRSYEETFSAQVEFLGEKGDVLVLISSSGNSPNVLKAAEQAKKQGLTVIGLTGFSGGALAKAADISVHIPANNYGVVEDAHQMFMHSIAQFLAKERDQKR